MSSDQSLTDIPWLVLMSISLLFHGSHLKEPTNDKFPKKELNDYGFDTMWIQDKVFYTSECKENFLVIYKRKLS